MSLIKDSKINQGRKRRPAMWLHLFFPRGWKEQYFSSRLRLKIQLNALKKRDVTVVVNPLTHTSRLHTWSWRGLYRWYHVLHAFATISNCPYWSDNPLSVQVIRKGGIALGNKRISFLMGPKLVFTVWCFSYHCAFEITHWIAMSGCLNDTVVLLILVTNLKIKGPTGKPRVKWLTVCRWHKKNCFRSKLFKTGTSMLAKCFKLRF